MRNGFVFLMGLFLISSAGAHEGHDKMPGVVSAPHPGGIVQSSGQLYVELVTKSDGVEIYAFDHDMKVVGPKELKLSATMTFPKKAKGEPVKLSEHADGFLAKISAKGSHRYVLDLVVTYKGKSEKVKFNVEPQ